MLGQLAKTFFYVFSLFNGMPAPRTECQQPLIGFTMIISFIFHGLDLQDEKLPPLRTWWQGFPFRFWDGGGFARDSRHFLETLKFDKKHDFKALFNSLDP